MPVAEYRPIGAFSRKRLPIREPARVVPDQHVLGSLILQAGKEATLLESSPIVERVSVCARDGQRDVHGVAFKDESVGDRAVQGRLSPTETGHDGGEFRS